MVEIFSTSLVILLITSPWEWVSRYFTGRSISLENNSSRIRFTIRWLSLALTKPWKSWLALYSKYTAAMSPTVGSKGLSWLPAIMSMALL